MLRASTPVVLLGTVLIGGCVSSGGSGSSGNGFGSGGSASSPQSETAAIAERRAREMAEAMRRGQAEPGVPGRRTKVAAMNPATTGRSPAGRATPSGGPPEVRWTDQPSASAKAMPTTATSQRSSAPPPGLDRPDPRSEDRPDPDATLDAALARARAADADARPRPEPGGDAVDAMTPDRVELLERVLADVRTGDDPAIRKALVAAAVSLAMPDRALDPAVLEGLDPRQRERVTRFHEALKLMERSVVDQQRGLNEDEVLARLKDVFGAQPIEITDLALCRRVRGFGVYDAFERTRFLAGRPHKMIVYVALDHFASRELAEDKHEVRLTQEIVLYNATDGLAVWRQRPVEVVDHARTVRRDFFVVQLIELPARLSVGKYVLKVKVRDLHGETMHEASQPIEIVADAALLDEREDR